MKNTWTRVTRHAVEEAAIQAASSVTPRVVLLALALVLLNGPWNPARAQRIEFERIVPVERGAVLVVEHHTGSLYISGNADDAVEVRARVREEDRIVVRDQGRRVRVNVEPDHRGKHEEVDVEIRVPEWMEVRVEGHQVDLEIDDVLASITVELVGGDIFVRGGRGAIDLRSVHGSITVRDAVGDIEIDSTNEDIELRDCTGAVIAESVNGDIRMEGIVSSEVEIQTTNGDVIVDAALESGGRYFVVTHNGDVDVSVPPDVDITIDVDTYDGGFESFLAVPFEEIRKGKSYRGVIGTGEGVLGIETFAGDVTLYDPKGGRVKRN